MVAPAAMSPHYSPYHSPGHLNSSFIISIFMGI
jgi:hypothetical protein